MADIYYGDRTPDKDDLQGLLGQCIASKIVPPGCKLGGTMVYKEHAAGRDPCATICPHDRREGEGGCGGRPPDQRSIYEQVGMVRKATSGAVEARVALVRNQVSYMNRLAADALVTRSQKLKR